MCQLCLESNEQMEANDNRLIGPNNEEHVGSSVLHAVSTEQGTVMLDGSSSHEPLLISPTISLTSRDSFALNSSDYSVDVNLCDGLNSETSRIECGQDDSKCTLPNGHLSKSTSSVNGYVLGKLDLRTSFTGLDLNDYSSSGDESYDEENELSPTFDDKDEIWDPPEAENEEDNKENSMATLVDDDDDECADGDGTEWAKTSSLNSSEEGVSISHSSKEEKQKAMEEVMNGRFKNLVSELLTKVGIDNCNKEDESWVDIVTLLAWQAASFVKPDATEGKAMDPAGYVKIKCIESGSPSESQVIKGLVFKKHAAHKHMATKYKNPRLLLMQGMLDQPSSSSGLSSFSSIKAQGKDNIADLIENLKACHPNVILVEKSASRDALEEVLKLGITLVLDMKPHRLKRVNRCTGSPILSFDNILSQKLKRCDALYFEKFVEEHARVGEGGKKPSKTLMFVEGCPTRLGCTILLKGSHSEELKKIKCVVQCAVVMAYHIILETSFLVDQKAMFSTVASGQETSNSPHSMEPNIVGASADGVQVPISYDSDERSSHVKETSARTAETATCNGFHEKVPHNTPLVDGPPTSSSIKSALEKVSIVSPATFKNMSTYIGAQTAASVPVSPTEEALDQCDMEARSNSKEDKALHNHSQPLSVFTTTSGDARKIVDDDGEDFRPKDEISSVLDSESILVLMSRRNATRGTICEQSHFSHIKFYRNFDVPLGKFLQDNLFNQSLPCKACGGPPEAHFYYYAHHNKQLTIRVKRLGDKSHLPGESEEKLWMWSRGKCEPDKEKVTKRVLISTAARGLSFGKFLELSFSSRSSFNRLSSCRHSFQKDFLYFFGLGSMVAMFQYSRVATYTVSVPSQKLEFYSSINRDWLQQEIESVSAKGLLLFTEVANYLKRIESRVQSSNIVLNGSSKAFADILDLLKLERSEFEENIKNIGFKDENSHVSAHKLLSLNRLRWEILLEACVWDKRLQLLSSSSSLVRSTSTNGVVPRQLDLEEDSGAAGEAEGLQTAAGKGLHRQMDHIPEEEVEGMQVAADEEMQGQMEKDHKIVDVQIETIACGGILQRGGEQDFMSLPTVEEDVERLIAEDSVSCFSLQESESTNLPSNNDTPHTDNVSLSDNLLEERLTSLPSNSEDSEECVWNSFSQIREECMKDLHEGSLPTFGHLPKFEKRQPLEYLPNLSQMIIEEALRLHIPVCDGDYIVSDYDGEISSSVACALTLMEDRMAPDSDQNASLKRASSEPSGWSLNNSIDPDFIQPSPSMPSRDSRFSSFDGINLWDSLISYGQLHPEVNLGIEKHLVKGKYSVVVMYAEEFRGLRNFCCPSELDYIASLSRCKIWDAKGGKSKSFFAKTLDDRLIIKEIKKTEFDSFLKFAPDYFSSMKESFSSGSQTCLAKILGIYQVTVRHAMSGKETKHDLMVQENLSFGRNITRQYDLKGALHARFTATADGTGDVLLDQNFVNDMNSSPLYIGQKAKRLLQRAVWNDTRFLNSINVMDYSLLVGVDRQKRELVCGIIDYMRQYTWDKQLETWVKSSLVVPKNLLPTIISPKEYKKRFRKFMDTHFLTVPDHWRSQRSSNPSKFCGIKSEDSSLVNSEELEDYLNVISSS